MVRKVRAGQPDRVHRGPQVTADQGQIRRLDRHVGAGPHGQPRSAWASAAASLTPSPTMATTRPSPCRRRMTATLSAGRTSAMTFRGDADLRGDRRGRPGVVPGEQHGAHPELAQVRDGGRTRRLDRVGDHHNTARPSFPGHPDGRPPLPLRRIRSLSKISGDGAAHGKPVTSPDGDRSPVHPARDAPSFGVLEVLHLGQQPADSLPRARRDRPANRVFRPPPRPRPPAAAAPQPTHPRPGPPRPGTSGRW